MGAPQPSRQDDGARVLALFGDRLPESAFSVEVDREPLCEDERLDALLELADHIGIECFLDCKSGGYMPGTPGERLSQVSELTKDARGPFSVISAGIDCHSTRHLETALLEPLYHRQETTKKMIRTPAGAHQPTLVRWRSWRSPPGFTVIIADLLAICFGATRADPIQSNETRTNCVRRPMMDTILK